MFRDELEKKIYDEFQLRRLSYNQFDGFSDYFVKMLSAEQKLHLKNEENMAKTAQKNCEKELIAFVLDYISSMLRKRKGMTIFD